jgi:hypothetical protein
MVAYALRNEFYDYDDFIVALRGNSVQWWHYIENTHVVLTQFSMAEFRDKLTAHIMPTDSLLIVPITQPPDGWLPPWAWEWLNSRVKAISEKNINLLKP